jgi:hypothetical protein
VSVRVRSVRATAGAYLAISLAVLGTVVWGFWASYFGPLLAGAVHRPWFIHVHAAVFLGWVTLLIAQASLIAFGKVEQHRRIGRAGAFFKVDIIAMSPVWATVGRVLLRRFL